MDCSLYDAVRAAINYAMSNDPKIARTMTLADALGAVEGKQQQSRILRLTGKLIVAIDRHRHF